MTKEPLKRWRENKFTFELIESVEKLIPSSSMHELFKEMNGWCVKNEKFHFFTFKGDDFRCDMMTFQSFDHIPKRVFVTMPHDKKIIAMAFAIIKKMNSDKQENIHWKLGHLSYDSDDFVHNRLTQEILIIQQI